MLCPQASLSSREKDHFELINYLRQENERKDRVIASLNESLKEQRQLLEKVRLIRVPPLGGSSTQHCHIFAC